MLTRMKCGALFDCGMIGHQQFLEYVCQLDTGALQALTCRFSFGVELRGIEYAFFNS